MTTRSSDAAPTTPTTPLPPPQLHREELESAEMEKQLNAMVDETKSLKASLEALRKEEEDLREHIHVVTTVHRHFKVTGLS